MKKAKIAILYDFDRTLSGKDQQEYSFIPSIGMKADEFWAKCDEESRKNDMDKILAYMLIMLKEAKKKNIPITREAFNKLGSSVQLLPGVESWFERINEFGNENNIEIEHFILSSGLKEIMEATSIAKYFKRIFASEYHYDEDGNADWPAVLVNFTTKTQFVFRISKGSLSLSDETKINTEVSEREVNYENMIYIGDGMTDVPCMQLIRDKGGCAIALYHHKKKDKVAQLLIDKRVDFACRANYEENSDLDLSVKKVIEKIKIKVDLEHKYQEQLKEALRNGE